MDEPLEIMLDYQLVSGPVRADSHPPLLELDWRFSAFPDDWRFSLRDNVTGEELDLREQSVYSFELTGKGAAKATSVKTQDFASPLHQVVTPKVVKAKATEGGPRFTLTVLSGNTVSNEPGDGLPQEFALQQNYPNPFNPATVIRYQLPVSSKVNLRVFDILGREVAVLINGQVEAGYHQVTFNARNLASGMYIYRLQTGNSVFTKKLTLIK